MLFKSIEHLKPKDFKKLYEASFKRKISLKTIEKKWRTMIGFVALENNIPVAYYGVFYQPINGFTSYQSGWTMTHPDYRGIGLFVRLAEMTYTKLKNLGADFVFGFPNEQSYRGFVKLRWKFYGSMYDFVVKTGFPPINEAFYKLNLSGINPKEKKYKGIRYKVFDHVKVASNANMVSYLELPKLLRAIGKNEYCSKVIYSISENHYQFKQLIDFDIVKKTLPVGFYEINKDIDYRKFTFTGGHYDTYN